MNDEAGIATALRGLEAAPPPDLVASAVAGGKRRLRRRRIAVAGTTSAVVAAMAVGLAVITVPNHQRPAPTTVFGAGPTAQQLADGTWVAMPAPPAKLCDPFGAVAGDTIAVVEYGYQKCSPSVSIYVAATNRWTSLPVPPRDVVGDAMPLVAWDGDRLALISQRTGAAELWTPASNTWRSMGSVPGTDPGPKPNAAAWVDNQLDVISTRDWHAQDATASAWTVGSGWSPLPPPPVPTTGWVGFAEAVPENGTLVAVAGIVEPNHQNAVPVAVTGTQLWRLDDSGWSTTTLSSAAPLMESALLPLTRGFLDIGTTCPSMCSLNDTTAAILNDSGDVQVLNPAPGTPVRALITAGGAAVVFTYPGGAESLGRPVPQNTSFPYKDRALIYDVSTRTWLDGPRAPFRAGLHETLWTTSGVVSLESHGGWLLQPAPGHSP